MSLKIEVSGWIGSLLLLHAASAGTYEQSFPFSFSGSGTTSPSTIVNAGDFTASVNPFDSGLGTLMSFSVDWAVDYSIHFTTGPSGGSVTINTGGSYLIDNISYAGNGGGAGNGGPPDSVYDPSFSVNTSSNFAVSGFGVGLNPSDFSTVLSAVTGTSPFPIQWNSSYTPSFYNTIASWRSQVTGTAKVTYTFVPEPASNTVATAGVLVCAAFVLRRAKKRNSTV